MSHNRFGCPTLDLRPSAGGWNDVGRLAAPMGADFGTTCRGVGLKIKIQQSPPIFKTNKNQIKNLV